MKVAIIGTACANDPVQIAYGEQLKEMLESPQGGGHEAIIVAADENLAMNLLALHPDVAISALAGATARDGGLQDVLNMLDIGYVGSGAQPIRSTAEREALTTVMAYRNSTSFDVSPALCPEGLYLTRMAYKEFGAIDAIDRVIDRFAGFPLAVRPALGAQAIAAHRVESKQQLIDILEMAFLATNRVLIRSWIEGVNMNVTVIGSGQDAYALPPIELADGGEEVFAPVRLESLSPDEAVAQSIRSEVERAAVDVFNAYGLEDVAQIGLVWDGASCFVVAIDPTPVLMRDSLVDRALQAAGLTLPALLDSLVEQFY